MTALGRRKENIKGGNMSGGSSSKEFKQERVPNPNLFESLKVLDQYVVFVKSAIPEAVVVSDSLSVTVSQ